VRPAVPRWRGTGATMIGSRCSGPAPGKVAGGGSLGSGHGLTLDQKVGVRIPAARPGFACSSNKNRVGVARAIDPNAPTIPQPAHNAGLVVEPATPGSWQTLLRDHAARRTGQERIACARGRRCVFPPSAGFSSPWFETPPPGCPLSCTLLTYEVDTCCIAQPRPARKAQLASAAINTSQTWSHVSEVFRNASSLVAKRGTGTAA
jgi:hypothetical protein